MELGLHGRRALVTASSRGLGLAVATALATEGAQVTLAARTGKDLERAAQHLERSVGSSVRSISADLSRPHDVELLIEQAGPVDVLVLNAGGPRIGGFFDKTDESEWRHQLELHFFSAWRLLHGLVPGMRSRGWGRVLALVSRTVKLPRPDNVISGAVRLPILSILRVLADEVGADGVTVNAVCAGPFQTERLLEVCRQKAKLESTTVDEQLSRFASGVPLGRVGRPEEIGAVCAFLASEPAAFVTGQVLLVDGGSVPTLF